jgi:hypothetical protein
MKRLSSCQQRLRHVTLVAALAATGAMMLMGGAASSAWANSTFNCENASESKLSTCLIINGPNETMAWGEGDNYSYPEFLLTFFKYNGGSNYTEIYSHVFDSYTGSHCYGSFDGHLRVISNGEYDNLAGNQKSSC